MNKLIAFISVTLLLVLSGCASVPMAPLEQDAKAKEFMPAQGRAALYIYRSENFGGAIPMTVTVNSKAIGQTAAKTYFLLSVPPGKYMVESHAENISNLSLTTEAGKNYFVWQEVKMGMWMARSLLQQVDEAAGRAGVAESKLIATTVTESDLLPAGQAPTNDAAQKLRELQNLRKDNVITEEEFQKKRQDLLEKL
ncbi:MAG: DUF2846 domain-containing protein [Rhodocyclaceae bacterium]|jgi:hypothetical protein